MFDKEWAALQVSMASKVAASWVALLYGRERCMEAVRKYRQTLRSFSEYLHDVVLWDEVYSYCDPDKIKELTDDWLKALDEVGGGSGSG